MQWTKTRTPGGAEIKEHLLTVWWQCAKQLSQRICVDKSQLPEHLHFLSDGNRVLNASSDVCVLRSRHAPPAADAFQTQPSHPAWRSPVFQRSRQGRGRWMASVASRYIERGAIETNEPCYTAESRMLKDPPSDWAETRGALPPHRSPESRGCWKQPSRDACFARLRPESALLFSPCVSSF